MCYKKYYKECGLFSHMISHLRRTPYVCSICHHRFPTNVHLDKHFNTHQINEKSAYFCHLCKCEIPDLETFTTHTQTHKNQLLKEEENAAAAEENQQKTTDENKTNENGTTNFDVPNVDDISCILDENAVGDPENPENGKNCMWYWDLHEIFDLGTNTNNRKNQIGKIKNFRKRKDIFNDRQYRGIRRKHIFCPFCLQNFSNNTDYKQHILNCQKKILILPK